MEEDLHEEIGSPKQNGSLEIHSRSSPHSNVWFNCEVTALSNIYHRTKLDKIERTACASVTGALQSF